MKVIGINGSSRKDSNTTILIKYIFKELNKEGIETELVTLYDKKLIPVVPALLVIVEKIVFIKMILMMFLTK